MKVGEHPKQDKKVSGCLCEYPVAIMVTYERPGLLRKAVESFYETTDGIKLIVVDDGSESPEKRTELDWLETETMASYYRMPHRGFIDTWLKVLWMVRNYRRENDSIIMLEDDIIFANGWVDVLQRMQRGITDRGFKQGLTSCFMPHDKPQSVVVGLQGVEAYQSMAHTWHCNMMPLEVLKDWHVLEEAAKNAKKSVRGLGIDVYYVGGLAHCLQRVSFVSTASWVKHIGAGNSVVESQGYGPCHHQGFNLVSEIA